MHDVPDADEFARQLHCLRQHSPFPDPRTTFAGDKQFISPSDGVILTFDDGDRSVLENGLPVLREFGITAIMFVCPGPTGEGEPHWWQTVDTALRAGWVLPDGHTRPDLKRIGDPVRRALVAEAKASLTASIPVPVGKPELEQWLDAKMLIGNHTWDHPCLDRCSELEQIDQVERAHEWLRHNVDFETPMFAYPNGNRTDIVENALRRLNYRAAFLFDHGIVSRTTDRLRVSRLRIDAGADPMRTRAIVDGPHSLATNLARSMRVAR